MAIEGYEEYKRREFCKDIRCQIQQKLNQHPPESKEYEEIRHICQTDCIQTAYQFHHWLIDHGYLIIRGCQ